MSATSSASRQPVLFLPHGGGPCFFMDWQPPDTWTRLQAFLAALPGTLPRRPRALIVVSAHWEAERFTVQRQKAPGLLFDYYGFPPHTYDLAWPAPGAPELADDVARRLAAAHLPCDLDTRRGYDHGVFVPLLVAFPAADIACVQLSLRADLDPRAHLAAGQALAPLRDEGVLIIGSGNTYHNMAVMRRAMAGEALPVQGVEFDAWLGETVALPDADERARRLIAWESAPGARAAAPREEHLLPLCVAAGAAASGRGTRIFQECILGALQSAYRFD